MSIHYDGEQPDPAAEIAAWKREEMRSAAELARLIAAVNPSGARLLGDWVPVFDYTARCAEQQRRMQTERPGWPAGAVPSDPPLHAASYLKALHDAARAQTEAFASHLERLADGLHNDRRAAEAEALAQAAAAARARLAGRKPAAAGGGTAIPAAGGSGAASAAEAEAGFASDHRAQFSQPDDEPADHRQREAVPIGGHTLPPLPYAYDALEPYIDKATMRLHHDKHHRAYVDGLNRAERALQAARASGQFDLVKHWERELAFNGAGHCLHTIFWNVMSPQGGGRPTGALADAINASFGSFEAFQRQFSAAAEQVEGGGWAILVWSPRSGRLEILQAEKHQNLSQWDVVPLLPLDVWEHAYYLKHQNRRADYIRDWWNVVNWPYVAERFAKASQLRWEPY